MLTNLYKKDIYLGWKKGVDIIMEIKKRKNRSKASYQIVDYLERSITQGKYLPGEKLRMAEIARELGVSRIPVSEAFQYMGNQGLIELIDNQGAYVRKYTIEEARDIYQVWTHMELLSCRLASENMNKENEKILRANLNKQKKVMEDGPVFDFTVLNREFHMCIAEIAGNGFLYEMVDNILKRVTMFGLLSLWYPERVKQAYEEHVDLMASIMDKDYKMIEKQVFKHMEEGFRQISNRNSLLATIKIEKQ